MQEADDHSGVAALVARVIDNPAASRFELTVDGQTALLVYDRDDTRLTLVHTEVPEALRGRHLGEALVEFALNFADAANLRVVAICPFVRAYLKKHPPQARA